MQQKQDLDNQKLELECSILGVEKNKVFVKPPWKGRLV